jgi:hypothetical protein
MELIPDPTVLFSPSWNQKEEYRFFVIETKAQVQVLLSMGDQNERVFLSSHFSDLNIQEGDI